MKNTLFTFILLAYCFFAFGQSEPQLFKKKQLQAQDLAPPELKGQLIRFDFSKLFTQTDNAIVYGFIGNTYERIRIKFISVTKSNVLADTYYVYGKSMVKTNIEEFRGSVTISNIRKRKVTSNGVDDMYKNTGIKGQFVIVGDYSFSEDKKQRHSGKFKGVFISKFYVDKDGNAKYDDIDSASDSFTNNQFIGEWRSYNERLIQRCNWGDFRIPNSGDLDIGAGDFSPNAKYLKNGWQGLATEMAANKDAKKPGEIQWWK
ncbi:hypothetical protein KXD93_19595 [Mucilaginibacter sp. BJC16-A38]|uniref:hypothetical protein n=1 Tax=Mucilaginibacter phenanthrenivorans TaxID=1234842 RepID=UPI0021572075|nr:hypothetical protein [Mucilaginibacter phenanthrenivorans]MCR8559864.1 hypothetical protein [Mucilaginibacter phenanthrenivorans]